MTNIDKYMNNSDWRVNENANNGNPTFSGLMLYLANTEIAKHALENMYNKDISNAHKTGALHIHDLGYAMIPYCCGWSLGKLIKEGINKIPGKASSAPARHLNSLMIQMVNFLGCMQMEAAGAEAFNNVDTHLAPFVKKDNLSYEDVKQYMQQLVFNLNIPSRWGCVSEDTEILTMNGWKAYELLKQGEHIATYNLNTQKTEYYPVQKINVYEYIGNLVQFRSDNLDILTTPTHRNVTRFIGKFNEEMVYSDNLFENPLAFSFPYVEHTDDVLRDRIKFSKIGEKLLYKYNGKVWCPTVTNGTFFARRNKKIFITGNSQAPFTNFSFDIKCPEDMKDQKAWVEGKEQEFTYGDCQKEMDLINLAFMEIMENGDSDGQPHTFPIPTYNIEENFDWDSEVTNKLMEMTSKYGIPYFANYVSSGLQASDIRSMCCRLSLRISELRSKHGGLFGSGDQTGAVGVVTINLPRIGYTSNTIDELYNELDNLLNIAKESLDIKRKVCVKSLESGFLPYMHRYLDNGFNNHFSTIGIVGMNELLLNFINKDITTPEGNKLANKILDHINIKLSEFQENSQDNVLYNLEATPAEGTSYRLAKIDKELYPDIITANEETPYYTNSVHLPVGYTDDIFEVLNLEDEMQTKFTSGTVIHLYLGQKIDNPQITKKLIKSIVENFKLPYISVTPTFSTCINCGYIPGEVYECEKCGEKTLIWSRVTGYIRPIQNYNTGKKQEFKDRKFYEIKETYNA
jgi:anaerobic ribonucleoside-triphosphate reductase